MRGCGEAGDMSGPWAQDRPEGGRAQPVGATVMQTCPPKARRRRTTRQGRTDKAIEDAAAGFFFRVVWRGLGMSPKVAVVQMKGATE